MFISLKQVKKLNLSLTLVFLSLYNFNLNIKLAMNCVSSNHLNLKYQSTKMGLGNVCLLLKADLQLRINELP